eukprot:CAMPEP_0171097764 /NCGR_PEP_ID=MMETSP0766_2-20121228/47737_1 /TAXON_ID=439317 /ORGANISM="Gambierdiscus australes, Strain CAWD 149" /LENGTH=117 /DNA_ID=CAMNT_0011557011 /DNA_START=18 /DNA_END=371 /DNA_ORIENTATION=-
MVGTGSGETLAKPGHPAPHAFWAACGRILRSLRGFALLGYALEWLVEVTHVSHRLHRWLSLLHSPKFELLAVTMIIVGHLGEHSHQEEENHQQEERLAALESRIATLEGPVEPKKEK